MHAPACYLHSLTGDDRVLNVSVGQALGIPSPQMHARAPYLNSLTGDERVVNHRACGWEHGAMLLTCHIQATSLRVQNQL